MEIFTLWLWPLLALVLLPGLLVYFGLHVVERGVIFVDLALAQIAALGICVALALGAHPGHDVLPYVLSLVFTLLGAALFAWTRFRHPRVPQESIIGIIYVVAAAAATVVLSHTAEGDEALKNLLVGNVLLVTKGEVLRTFALFAAIAVVHIVLRRKFLLVSFHEDEARARGMALRGLGLPLLCDVRSDRHQLRPDHRGLSRLLVPDRAGGVRRLALGPDPQPLDHRLGRRPGRRHLRAPPVGPGREPGSPHRPDDRLLLRGPAPRLRADRSHPCGEERGGLTE